MMNKLLMLAILVSLFVNLVPFYSRWRDRQRLERARRIRERR